MNKGIVVAIVAVLLIAGAWMFMGGTSMENKAPYTADQSENVVVVEVEEELAIEVEEDQVTEDVIALEEDDAAFERELEELENLEF